MKNVCAKSWLTGAVLAAIISTHAEPAKITVAVDRPGHEISPTLWGIFFEDINLSADGGIYPEMVRNRSYEDADKPTDWNISGAVAKIDDSHPLNPFNRRSLLLKTDGAFTVENAGYWGMNIVAGETYRLKLAARAAAGFNGPLTVTLLGVDGKELAVGELPSPTGDWKYYTLELKATGTDPKAKLVISGKSQGNLSLDMVSLLPAKTWKDHGLRPDLAESLDGLHPSFLRFPGGCWVEGDDFAHMNRWKNTIGNIDTRTPLWNIWGYYATHGLGFYEYLQLAEDLGAEPLFCINVGMSHHEVIPLDRMDQWVQDALDAVEFANGPTNSLWGARRAQMGHPAPFNLKFMEIGNENGGPNYIARWPLYVNALRAKYPYLQFISNSDLRGGPYPKSPAPDLVDEHYYESPEAFMNRAGQYDNYNRQGPKIFIGEYAVTSKCGQGNLRAAIGEAAFMTGMERNSDIVRMASYAPLLVNLNHRAWNPDLINFDSSKWYGLPGYYVQQMFSRNRGDVTLPVTVDSPDAESNTTKGQIGVGTWNTAAEYKDIKVTAPNDKVLFTADFSKGSDDWKKLGGGEWTTANGALQENSEKEFVRALAGDQNWTDYTLTLKARKLHGAEGFLILFHIAGDEDRVWWNLGGWGNTQDAIESGSTLDGKPGQIETGRWYDIRVVVSGKNVKCYLDGQLVHDVNYESGSKIKALYACSSLDKQTGEVIVKVVNADATPLATTLELTGTAGLTGQGSTTVLTSDSPADENSLAEPTKVSPKTETFDIGGTSLTRSFPGNSFTVLRLKTKN